MFKKIVIVIVVLIAAILVFAATRPDSFRVQRSAIIKAPPEKTHENRGDIAVLLSTRMS